MERSINTELDIMSAIWSKTILKSKVRVVNTAVYTGRLHVHTTVYTRTGREHDSVRAVYTAVTRPCRRREHGRVSVTRRNCVKTTARSTVQFARSDSKMCLVLWKPKNIPQGRPLPPEILAQDDLPPPDSSAS